MMEIRKVFQQGDVLFYLIDELPQSRKKKKVERKVRGNLVIDEGETPGHFHAVVEEDVEKVELYSLDEILHVVADDEVEVVHPEHETVKLPKGVFEVGKVREQQYSFSDLQRVSPVTD